MKHWKVILEYKMYKDEMSKMLLNVVANNKEEMNKKIPFLFNQKVGNLDYRIVNIYEL